MSLIRHCVGVFWYVAGAGTSGEAICEQVPLAVTDRSVLLSSADFASPLNRVCALQ